MRPLVKGVLVLGGYVGAVVAASVAVAVNDARMDPVTRQSGMAAGGDMILWLGVFALASVPETGAGLFFLRPVEWFWRGLCRAALFVAATAVLAAVGYFVARGGAPGTPLYYWGASSVLRLLVTPLFGALFFVCGMAAPARSFRLQLLGAALFEGVALGCFALGIAMSFAG
jgi:hypothetical protein